MPCSSRKTSLDSPHHENQEKWLERYSSFDRGISSARSSGRGSTSFGHRRTPSGSSSSAAFSRLGNHEEDYEAYQHPHLHAAVSNWNAPPTTPAGANGGPSHILTPSSRRSGHHRSRGTPVLESSGGSPKQTSSAAAGTGLGGGGGGHLISQPQHPLVHHQTQQHQYLNQHQQHHHQLHHPTQPQQEVERPQTLELALTPRTPIRSSLKKNTSYPLYQQQMQSQPQQYHHILSMSVGDNLRWSQGGTGCFIENNHSRSMEKSKRCQKRKLNEVFLFLIQGGTSSGGTPTNPTPPDSISDEALLGSGGGPIRSDSGFVSTTNRVRFSPSPFELAPMGLGSGQVLMATDWSPTHVVPTNVAEPYMLTGTSVSAMTTPCTTSTPHLPPTGAATVSAATAATIAATAMTQGKAAIVTPQQFLSVAQRDRSMTGRSRHYISESDLQRDFNLYP